MYDLLNLLDNILGPHQKFARNEYYYTCPFCHHAKPKLAINVAKGVWHCWVCLASGKKLLSLFRKLDCSKEHINELRKILHEEVPHLHTDEVIASLSLPKEFHPLWEPSGRIDFKHAITYLRNRGISDGEMMKYQMGYCPEGLYANRIIVPSFDLTGKLNFFIGRSFYDETGMLKYKNPPVSKNVVGFENYVNWNYPIVLCEGIFDAIAIKRNAVPLFGKIPSAKLKEKIVRHNVRDIYLALDNDALRETTLLARHFMDDGRRVFVVELEGKDPSELGFAKMSELIKQAQPLSFSQLIRLKVSVQ